MGIRTKPGAHRTGEVIPHHKRKGLRENAPKASSLLTLMAPSRALEWSSGSDCRTDTI